MMNEDSYASSIFEGKVVLLIGLPPQLKAITLQAD